MGSTDHSSRTTRSPVIHVPFFARRCWVLYVYCSTNLSMSCGLALTVRKVIDTMQSIANRKVERNILKLNDLVKSARSFRCLCSKAVSRKGRWNYICILSRRPQSLEVFRRRISGNQIAYDERHNGLLNVHRSCDLGFCALPTVSSGHLDR